MKFYFSAEWTCRAPGSLWEMDGNKLVCCILWKLVRHHHHRATLQLIQTPLISCSYTTTVHLFISVKSSQPPSLHHLHHRATIQLIQTSLISWSTLLLLSSPIREFISVIFSFHFHRPHHHHRATLQLICSFAPVLWFNCLHLPFLYRHLTRIKY